MDSSLPAKSIMYLYIGSFGGMVLSYFYWFIVANITSTYIVGLASAAVSLMAIAWSSSDLGISYGMRRFVGEAARARDTNRIKKLISSSVLILLGSSLTIALPLLLIFYYSGAFSSIPLALIQTIVIAIVFANIAGPFQAVLISTMRTDYYAIVEILSSFAKIGFGTVLIIFGLEALGILLGLLAAYCISMTLGYILARMHLNREEDSETIVGQVSEDFNLIRAGFPNYAPGAIQTWGTKIGVLLVFGFTGTDQTGFYYIAMQFFAVALLLPNTLTSILYPYISGLRTGGKEVMSQGIRLSLAVSQPIMFTILLFPSIPLAIMGIEYIAASTILQILVLSLPFAAVIGGVHSLAYANGNYNSVLFLGLGANIPRIVMYFILTPLYGGEGAAIAYLVGSVIGFLFAVSIARKLNFDMQKGVMFSSLIPPLLISGLIVFLNLHWLIEVLIILSLSVLAYMKMNIIKREEIVLIGLLLLPKVIINRYGDKLKHGLDYIYN